MKITHVSLRTSNCGEIDIAYHVYVLTQGQAHFNWILSSTSNIIGVYYLARAKHNEIKWVTDVLWKQNLATINKIVNETDYKVEKIKFRTIVKSLIIFSLNSETVNYNFNSSVVI